MDVQRTAKLLGISNLAIIAKAQELVRLTKLKIPGGLGQGDLAVSSACLELASLVSGQGPDLQRQEFVRRSCCTAKVYQAAYSSLQKILDVQPRLDTRELCIQLGAVRLEPAVQRTVTTYKERFLAAMPGGGSGAGPGGGEFSRTVLLAAAFYLVARKSKVRVERSALLQRCCVSADAFSRCTASMYKLCFDTLGVEKQGKRRRVGSNATGELLEGTRAGGAGDAHGSSDEDEEGSGDDDEVPGGAKRGGGRRVRQEDFDSWKERVTNAHRSGGAVRPAGKPRLKQAKLSFG